MITKKYTIVKTEDDFSKMYAKILEWPYMAFDTETTGLNTRKSRMMGFSICGEPGVAFYYPVLSWEDGQLYTVADNHHHIVKILNIIKKKELLTWNGSFDVRIVESNYNIDLTDSIVADGMLLKHTLNEEGPFGLKKVAIELQKELGLDIEKEANEEQIILKENVKANGGTTTANNYEMYKADLDVMGPYAAADVDLTFRICEYYLKKLQDEGLESFFFDDEVMPLYKKVTIPMEKAGVRLDLPLIGRLKEEIEVDILELEGLVIETLMKTQGAQEWLWDKIEDHCEAKLSGKYFQAYCRHVGDHYFKKSEKTGKYLVPKDYQLMDFDAAVIHQIKESVYMQTEGKRINIFSKKQMGEVAFNYLGYTPLSETDKGAPQFNEEFLDSIKGEAKWAELLLDYNKLVKIKGSYIDRYLDGQEDGRYYFSYKQHGTISGRYGSDAQQLPRPQEEGSPVVLKYSNQIRKFFITEQGRAFIDCDYESLEPHTFAHVSGDAGLQEIFTSGKDFYSKIAIDTEGLDQYSAVKTDPNYLGKVNKDKRQLAKVYALGIPYGMGGYALGKNLNIPTHEAEELVEGYLSAYPDLKSWMDRSKKMAQYEGYVKSEVGRVRHLPKVKAVYAKYGDKILDIKFRNMLSRKIPKEYVLSLYLDYKNGINNARNFQIQSMAASIVNRAAIKVTEEFKRRGIDGLVCAQIHDQLIFNVPEDKAKECSEIVKDIMENNIKLSVGLKAPPMVAKNWYEGH